MSLVLSSNLRYLLLLHPLIRHCCCTTSIANGAHVQKSSESQNPRIPVRNASQCNLCDEMEYHHVENNTGKAYIGTIDIPAGSGWEDMKVLDVMNAWLMLSFVFPVHPFSVTVL